MEILVTINTSCLLSKVTEWSNSSDETYVPCHMKHDKTPSHSNQQAPSKGLKFCSSSEAMVTQAISSKLDVWTAHMFVSVESMRADLTFNFN